MMPKHRRQPASVIALAFLAWTATGAAAAACTVTGIEIMQTTLAKRGSKGQYPNIVGELRNNCAEPVGVELLVTFRDAQGKVVSATSFWPGSVKNIPALTRWPIDHPGEENTTPSTVELVVASVKKWSP